MTATPRRGNTFGWSWLWWTAGFLAFPIAGVAGRLAAGRWTTPSPPCWPGSSPVPSSGPGNGWPAVAGSAPCPGSSPPWPGFLWGSRSPGPARSACDLPYLWKPHVAVRLHADSTTSMAARRVIVHGFGDPRARPTGGYFGWPRVEVGGVEVDGVEYDFRRLSPTPPGAA